MNVGQLAEKDRELYGEPTRTRNKEYLRKRLAWRIQEQVEGGLSASALERIAQLGDDVPERWRMRQSAQEQARKVSVKLVFPIFFLIFPAILLVTLGPAVILVFNALAKMLAI